MFGKEVAWGALFIIEGISAAEDGRMPADNPYEPGSQQQLLWFAGYDEASLGTASIASRVPALA